MPISDEHLERYGWRYTYVVLFLIVVLAGFGFVYVARSLTYVGDLAKGGVLGGAVAFNIARKSNMEEDLRENILQLKWNSKCDIGDTNDWYDDFPLSSCPLVWTTIQANDYCGWYDVGLTCVGFSIPAAYFENPEVQRRLFEGIRSPCKVFFDRKIEHFDDFFHKLSCNKGRLHAEYDVYVLVIDRKFHEHLSFEEMDENAEPSRLFFFDRSSGKISERYPYFPWFSTGKAF